MTPNNQKSQGYEIIIYFLKLSSVDLAIERVRFRVTQGDPNVPEDIIRRRFDRSWKNGRIEDLKVPPGNHLEALKGDHSGQHSIRINNQWRVCFCWTDAGAEDVEIVDYH